MNYSTLHYRCTTVLAVHRPATSLSFPRHIAENRSMSGIYLLQASTTTHYCGRRSVDCHTSRTALGYPYSYIDLRCHPLQSTSHPIGQSHCRRPSLLGSLTLHLRHLTHSTTTQDGNPAFLQRSDRAMRPERYDFNNAHCYGSLALPYS